ncbi:MAG: ferritin family protein [bacterium]
MSKQPVYDEIIQFAVTKEQEAFELYRKMAAATESASGKILFKELADMERGHKSKLERLDRDYFASRKIKQVMDLKIADYLVDVELKPDSSYQDILLYAAKREKAAFDLYLDLSRVYISTPEIKKIFEVLAQEEAYHKLKLEREYDENVYKEG